MARFLFYAGAGPRRIYPLVPTMLRLRARGHGIVIHADADDLALLGSLGVPARPVLPARAEAAHGRQASTDRPGHSPHEYDAQRLAWEAQDIRTALDAYRPDVTVVDDRCWGASCVMAASGAVWAQAVTGLLPALSDEGPALSRAPFTAISRLRHGADQARGRGAPPAGNPLPAVNQLRARLGLPRLRRLADALTQAPLVLTYSAEPLQRQPSHLRSVRLVGPGNWDPTDPRRLDWLDQLPYPVVLVAGRGVYRQDALLIQAVLDAFADAPVSVVATSPAHDPARFRVPANAGVHAFLPHREILARATVAVCAGGLDLTQKALLAGVPVGIVAFDRDGLRVADRVVRAEAGVCLPAARLHPSRLRLAVAVAQARRPGAITAGARLSSLGGPDAAADAVELLALSVQDAR